MPMSRLDESGGCALSQGDMLMFGRTSGWRDLSDRGHRALVFSLLSLLFISAPGNPGLAATRPALPQGFVYLSDVDRTIVQDIRYAGRHNFVGRPIAGYDAAECILTDKAARALAKVQAGLAARRLSLIVWDCYRPVRAVADFVKWSRNPSDTRAKAEFYPRVDKARLFAGYVAARSAHSRGSTVDLGIVVRDAALPSRDDATARQRPCYAPKGERFEDGSIDFGTGYDCLDPAAGTQARGLSQEARANRTLLHDLMAAAGFRPYRREWWHFELIKEPFPSRIFDFPIGARPAADP